MGFVFMSRQRMRLKATVFPILTIPFLIAGARPAKADSININLPSLLPGCLPATTSTCNAGVSSVSGVFSGLNFEMSALRGGSPGVGPYALTRIWTTAGLTRCVKASSELLSSPSESKSF